MKAEWVGMAVKAKMVGRDRSGVYGLFICFLFFFCYSTRHFFFRLSLSIVTLFLPSPSHMFSLHLFLYSSVLGRWVKEITESR